MRLIKEENKGTKKIQMFTFATSGFFVRLQQSGWTKKNDIFNSQGQSYNFAQAEKMYNNLIKTI